MGPKSHYPRSYPRKPQHPSQCHDPLLDGLPFAANRSAKTGKVQALLLPLAAALSVIYALAQSPHFTGEIN